MVTRVVEKTELVIEGKDNSARATESAARNMDRLDESYKKVRIGALAVAGAAAALGTAIVAGTARTLENSDALVNQADKIGATTRALQEYRFAAEQSGVAQGTLDMALQRASRRIGEAVNGTGELAGTLKQYGIEVTDAEGRARSLTDVLDDYAEAIQNAGSQQERLRLAFKAFDSEGAALVNLFSQGKEGLDEFRVAAERSGAVLEDRLARQAAAAQDALTRVNRIISVNLQRVLAQLAPTIIRVAESFESMAPQIRETTDAIAGLIFGVQALSLEGLREKLVETEKDLVEETGKLVETTKVLGILELQSPGRDEAKIKRLEREQLQLKALIELRTIQQEQLRKDLQFRGVPIIDVPANEKELAKAEALAQRVREQFLQVFELEEMALQERRDRRLLEIEESALSEEAKNTARLETEAIFQEQLFQIREDARLKELDAAAKATAKDEALIAQGHKRTLAMEKARRDAALAIGASFFSSAITAIGQGNKKLFKISKALAIVETVISTYSAAQKQFEFYSSLGPVAYAAAAAAIAAGLARVATIARQKYSGNESSGSSGGGGGGGFSGGGGGAAAPQVPAAQLAPGEAIVPQVISIELSGEGVVSTQWLRDVLIPQINELAGDGTQIEVA